MIVRKTALEEARRVNELFAICFEMPYANCPADPEKDDAAPLGGLRRGRRDDEYLHRFRFYGAV